jgi:hypothetical protein
MCSLKTFDLFPSYHNIYLIYVINIIVHVYLIIYLNLPYTWFRVELNTWTILIYKAKVRKWNWEFLKVSGDLFGVHESTVSRIIKRVSIALASLYKQYVKFTSGNKVQEIQRQFMQQSRIPGIVGNIVNTHSLFSLYLSINSSSE